jgi:hypothetical protein
MLCLTARNLRRYPNGGLCQVLVLGEWDRICVVNGRMLWRDSVALDDASDLALQDQGDRGVQ